jgi:hypothetical protein
MLTPILAALAAWKAKAAAAWALGKAKFILGIALAIAVVILAGFIYSMGASSERGKCNVAALRSEIATLKKDLDTIRKAAADERAKAVQLDALAAKQAQELRGYEDVVKKLKGACVLTDGDARSLR